MNWSLIWLDELVFFLDFIHPNDTVDELQLIVIEGSFNLCPMNAQWI